MTAFIETARTRAAPSDVARATSLSQRIHQEAGQAGKRSELVVFITPKVIRDSIDASIVSQELRAKMKLIK